jgi:hypothetical protein
MGEIAEEMDRLKCCLGRKNPDFALVNILCAFSGAGTEIAFGGRGG